MTDPIRYASYALFVGLVAALWFGLYWPWGLLFLFWVFLAIRNKETFLLGPISRRRDPIFYWLVVLLWALLSLAMVASDVMA